MNNSTMASGAALLGLVTLTSLPACYEKPSELGDREPLVVTMVAESNASDPLVADGDMFVRIHVDIHPVLQAAGSTVKIRTTTGILDLTADPQTDAARNIEVHDPGTGEVAVPLKVGNVPGEHLITVNLGNYETKKVLRLLPLPPSSIELSTATPSIAADGSSTATIDAELFAKNSFQEVSMGTRLRLRACCVNTDTDAPEECDTSGLITVPGIVELSSGQKISFNAKSAAALMGDPRKLWIVAEADTGLDVNAAFSCTVTSTLVRDYLRITLIP